MASGQQLVLAARENNLTKVAELIQNGVSTTARDDEGFTALFWACCRGNVDICRRLLRCGCDVNAKVKVGATALMACADLGRETCLRLLLQCRQLNLNERSDRGDSALHVSAYRGYPDIVRLLCLAGARKDLRNNDNHTPLEVATIAGHTDCVKLLNKPTEKESGPPTQSPDHNQFSGLDCDSSVNQQTVSPSKWPVSRTDDDGFVSSDSAIGTSFFKNDPPSYAYGNSQYQENKASLLNGSSRFPASENERLPTAIKINPPHSNTDASTGIGKIRSSLDYTKGCYSTCHTHTSQRESNIHNNWNIQSVPRGNTTVKSTDSHLHVSQTDPFHSMTSDYSSLYDDPSGPPAISYSPATNYDHVKTIYSSNHQISSPKAPITVTDQQNVYSLNNLSSQRPQNVQDKDMTCKYNISNGSDTRPHRYNIIGANSVQLASGKPDMDMTNDISKLENTDIPLSIGLKNMSSFVERLQMRVLALEESLHRESVLNNNLRKENHRLKEENSGLKTSLQNLSRHISYISNSSDVSQTMRQPQLDQL